MKYRYIGILETKKSCNVKYILFIGLNILTYNYSSWVYFIYFLSIDFKALYIDIQQTTEKNKLSHSTPFYYR